MTTGEEVIIRCAMKPIPTLYKPLNSININTLERYEATVERSDTCAVPACSVVCENVVAFVICQFFLETIGGSSLEDVKKIIIHIFKGWVKEDGKIKTKYAIFLLMIAIEVLIKL